MSPEILVAPLSLDQYWEAFWSNEAPYYIQAIIRDEEDSITRSTKWGPPEIYKELHGENAITYINSIYNIAQNYYISKQYNNALVNLKKILERPSSHLAYYTDVLNKIGDCYLNFKTVSYTHLRAHET